MELNKHNLKLLKKAEDDLNEILDFASNDRNAAAKKLSDFERVFLALILSTRLDREGPGEVIHSLKGYREVVYKDYLIFFKIKGSDIVIYRIIKGAKDYISDF